MSENVPGSAEKIDRRVVRTRDRLGDALIALLLEKSFDDVTVQDVLDRAGVSRSTFYAHYRDKNDLFLSDVDQFLESMATLLERSGDRSGRVAPVGEFFMHIAESRDLYWVMVESGRIHDLRELGEAHFARGIEDRLVSRAPTLTKQQRAIHAHALAGSIFSLLTWWVNHGMTPSARDMDQQFHSQLAWSVKKRANPDRPWSV
ncbi:MAG TPA: TetR/AcrR family transcriptional regulator [Bryobacteraceae bacterium]